MSHRPSRSGPYYRHRHRHPHGFGYGRTHLVMPREVTPARAHRPRLTELVRVAAALLALGFGLAWILAAGGAP